MAEYSGPPLRIACVYPLDDDPAVVASMDRIRFRRMAEAFARAGHHVDIVRRRGKIVPLGPRLRMVPARGIRWDRYDVVKTSLHKGFNHLLVNGGADHPFIISKLGSVVAGSPRPGVHFFGRQHEFLLGMQNEMAQRARAVTFLTDENEQAWLDTHGVEMLRLRVPTGVDAVIPPAGPDPFARLGVAGRGVLFAGNIYDREQPEVNRIWVDRLNRIARALKRRGLYLVAMGTGERSGLDQSVMTDLGPLPPDEVWDWQRNAVCGLVLAHGAVQDNESSKIYYYLRTELPVICEAPIPNRWLVEHTGLGAIVPLDDPETMADAVVSFAGRGHSLNGVADWMAREHSWDERAGRYAPLFEEAASNRASSGRSRALLASTLPLRAVAPVTSRRSASIVLVAPGMNERNVWGERIVLGSLARALPRAFPGARVELVDASGPRWPGRPSELDLLVSMCTGPRHPWRADDVAARIDGVSVLWVVNHPDLLSDFAALPFDGFMTNSRRAVSVLGVTRPTAGHLWGSIPATSLGAPQRRYRADVAYLGSGGIGNKAPATTHRYLDPAKRFDFALWGSNWSREYWAAAEKSGEVSKGQATTGTGSGAARWRSATRPTCKPRQQSSLATTRMASALGGCGTTGSSRPSLRVRC